MSARVERIDPPGLDSPQAVLLAVLFYLGFAAAAVLWDWLRDGPTAMLFAPDGTWPTDLGWGLGAAAFGIGASEVLTRVSRAGRRLEDTLREAIGRPSVAAVAVLALSSGIGEELFFRGAMQPSWGLTVTSLVFGFIHGFGAGPLRMWTLLATVAGFGLGGLYEVTESLLAPVVAHVGINFVNLLLISRRTRARSS